MQDRLKTFAQEADESKKEKEKGGCCQSGFLAQGPGRLENRYDKVQNIKGLVHYMLQKVRKMCGSEWDS